jgi:adenosylhomocysteine nucleosidase
MITSSTLVCFALKEEAGPFRRAMAGRAGVSILLTGIGRGNAERHLREFLAANSPTLVLTCGFAGGLNPDLSLGSVVFSTGDITLEQKLSAAGAMPAKILCAQRIATTAAEKQALRRSTGADVVEMESEAIQSICCERGIPCATVRVISDSANEDLPLDFNKLSKSDLSLDYVKLATALVKHPRKIPALLRLQKNCSFAAGRLADVLAKVI